MFQRPPRLRPDFRGLHRQRRRIRMRLQRRLQPDERRRRQLRVHLSAGLPGLRSRGLRQAGRMQVRSRLTRH